MASYDWKSEREKAGKGISVVPTGEYDAEIVRTNVKPTKKGDKDTIHAVFRIMNGPHANEEFMNGFTISPESPPAMGIFFQHVTALGIELEDQELSELADLMVGKVVRVAVTVDPVFNRTKLNPGGMRLLEAAPAAPEVPTPAVPAAAPGPAPAPAATPPPTAPALQPAPTQEVAAPPPPTPPF